MINELRMLPQAVLALVAKAYDNELPVSLVIHRIDHTGMIPVTAEYCEEYHPMFNRLLHRIAQKSKSNMSKKNQVLLITPPLFPREHHCETETFSGLPCTYCHGNGWIPTLGERNEHERTACPVCKGRKKLKAVVTVKWMPDGQEQ